MSMETLPSHWLSLVAAVFLLGLKHGLDPDHLAAIDGLTRFNARERPALSRWSGLLFSAGHGVVVTLVAIAVATVATEWKAPQWLENAGTWISITGSNLAGWMFATLLVQVASWGMALSVGVVVAVAVSYGVAMRLAAQEA